MMIPEEYYTEEVEEYYTEEVEVKLTQSEIQCIIEELGRVQHDIFTFMNYNRIIDKLKKVRGDK